MQKKTMWLWDQNLQLVTDHIWTMNNWTRALKDQRQVNLCLAKNKIRRLRKVQSVLHLEIIKSKRNLYLAEIKIYKRKNRINQNQKMSSLQQISHFYLLIQTIKKRHLPSLKSHFLEMVPQHQVQPHYFLSLQIQLMKPKKILVFWASLVQVVSLEDHNHKNLMPLTKNLHRVIK